MDQIPVPLFEPIANLIGDIFTFRDLDQVLFKTTGERTINEIATADWPPRKIAVDTLRWVEKDGKAKPFFALLLEARPSRADLREKILAAMPDLAVQAQATQASVAQVVDSLNETRQGLADPAVRRAVATSRGTLQAFALGVDVLAAYKDLHDSLHQIQIRRFSDLRAATARMSDPDQLDKLISFEDLLAPCILVARSAARRLPDEAQFRATEATWIDSLETADRQLNGAIAALNADGARIAVKVVGRTLILEPPRLNRAIFLTAQRLPIQALVEALETAGGLNASANAMLAAACNALRDIRATLVRRVVDHHLWQEADEKLWSLDTMFQQSGNDVFALFSEDWTAAKSAVKSLAEAAPDEAWAKAVIASADLTDDELTRAEGEAGSGENLKAIRDRLYRRYSDFRHGARFRFFTVDQLLKEDCDSIVKIGAPLQSILRELGDG